jgi:hypothetical protein
MRNKQDIIMAAGTAGNANTVVNYVLLGRKIEDGIFVWINRGGSRSRGIGDDGRSYKDLILSSWSPKWLRPILVKVSMLAPSSCTYGDTSDLSTAVTSMRLKSESKATH